MHITEQEPLAPYTTFRLGGPARFFARITRTEDIPEALAFAKAHAVPVLFLGGGSNVLIGAEGFAGLVLKIELRGIEKKEAGDTLTYVVAAGEQWDAFVFRTCSDGYWGLENLSGIPGTVGAAPVQNIGAYGAELMHTLAWVEVFDTKKQVVTRYTKEACEFSYRTSLFKKEVNRYLIMRVAFTLSKKGTPQTTYKDVAALFLDTVPTTPQEVREAILRIRAGKFPDLAVEGTAGSFFLNPTVPREVAELLLSQYPGLPHYPVAGGVKLSLAWLLDQVLHMRGVRVGGARLYEKQPLVIVADTTATAKDISLLQKKVTEQVAKTFFISLTPEVRII